MALVGTVPLAAAFQWLLGVALILVAVPTLTYAITTLRYREALRHFQTLSSSKTQRARLPPLLPYNIPLLGHALVFLNRKPGSFHRRMQRHFTANPSVGCFSILLAGQRAHIISSADLVTRLFKFRGVNRAQFNRDVMVNSNGLSKDEGTKSYEGEGGEIQTKMNEDINKQYLLGPHAVNTLTGKFMETFEQQLKEHDGEGDIALYRFVMDAMFVASTVALYGTEIMQRIPNLDKLFWPFENGMLARLFQIPRVVMPDAYKALDNILGKWEGWTKYAMQKGGGDVLDQQWDELMGARVIRERHQMYEKIGLSDRGRASFDLGFMFGLNSNAIPATGWTLCHLLQPSNSDLLANVRREIDHARQPNGTVNIPILMSSPYLNSCLHETLRCYVDALITRTLTEDLIMDQYLMRKGDIIIAPTYLGHHDAAWSNGEIPPEQFWYGKRFLRQDEKTGEVTFSTTGMNGRFFPFGGGTYVCPGRVFAKQEIIGAIATFLSSFDAEFVEYVSFDKRGALVRKGVEVQDFPTIKEQFSGAGVVIPAGDMLVRLKRRT